MHSRALFSFFFAGLLCLMAEGAVPDTGETRADTEAQTETPLWPVAAFEIGYFAPDFPNYGGYFSSRNRKVGSGIRFVFEYMPLVGRAGKLGVSASLGYGRIGASNTTPFLEVLPMEAAINYHFDYIENQLLVPFIYTGLTVIHAHEQFVPGMQRFNGVEYGGGVALSLDFIDRMSAHHLQQSVGIKNTYALVDYRRVDFLGKPKGPNLTRNEVRFSLRFEF